MDNYFVTESRYKYLRDWLRDYPKWKEAIRSPRIYSSSVQGTDSVSEWSDPTANSVIGIDKCKLNLQLFEDALRISETKDLEGQILSAVIFNTEFDDPDFMFMYRKFFYYLDRLIL